MSKRKGAGKKEDRASEAQLLELVTSSVGSHVSDPSERDVVLTEIQKKFHFLTLKREFQEFFKTFELKSLQASEIYEVKRWLSEAFPNEQIELQPDKEKNTLSVEVRLTEGVLSGQLTVQVEEEKEVAGKFIAYPVCLSGDTGLVWEMGRVETLSVDEARQALNVLEADFWGSRKGLKLLRKGTKKSFDEFITRASAASLKERGLRRLFKDPAPTEVVDKGIINLGVHEADCRLEQAG